jgi:hypothetical protein
MDTSPLQGHAQAPFFLDFQLVDGTGAGDGNTSVTVRDFEWHGGSWDGPPAFTIEDTVFFGEIVERFEPGPALSFTVAMTTNADAGPTPDRFTLALLDENLAEVPTLGPGSEFVGVDISSRWPVVEAYGSNPLQTSIRIPTPLVVVIPEAPGGALAAVVFFGGAFWLRRRGSWEGRAVPHIGTTCPF